MQILNFLAEEKVYFTTQESKLPAFYINRRDHEETPQEDGGTS